MGAVANRRTQPIWQRVFLYALVIAFALQSIVTQSHMHLAAPWAAAVAEKFDSGSKIATSQTNRDNNYPVNDDPANCPICQAIALAGNFVAPSAASPILPHQEIVAAAPQAALLLICNPVSHIWRGRGPPTA